MTDRPTALREVDDLHLDPAPVGDLLATARRSRTRRRALIGTVAAVSLLLVGGGAVAARTLDGPGRDGDAVIAGPTGATSAEPALTVGVRPGGPDDETTPVGDARWNPVSRTVTYVTSSLDRGCLPDGTATSSGTTVALELLPATPEAICKPSSRTAVVSVSGLESTPTALTVEDDGTTTRVPLLGLEPITDLVCTTPGRSGTAGGLLTETPDGVPTREQLVAETSTPERPMVLAGDRAFVLRPDGSPSEEHYVRTGTKGFYFNGYEGC